MMLHSIFASPVCAFKQKRPPLPDFSNSGGLVVGTVSCDLNYFFFEKLFMQWLELLEQ